MKTKITLLLLVVTMTNVFAQKVKSGSFDFLKGQTEINVLFDYADLTVGKKKISEAEYLKKRAADVKEKNPNEDFYKVWEEYKEEKFPNKFFASINKSSKIKFSKNPKAKYTLIVKSEWLNPGVPGMTNSLLNSRLVFVETENQNKQLLIIDITKAKGKSMTMNRNSIMSESYAMTGKKLGNFLSKKVK
ncbi:hypothetical protein [Flavobacterium sp. NKUCC04_CG]|uniref:hypothetical protein n=1 Tax=Flavobacterium sp. NKUCC04_CG TaxID=2842121 RepID=UPI001C5B5A69|nr:hypothetical protein [Flavobacterium sp. NKUCC04_CG]MBW3519775.1 hypothetical protein [Flavobacterium sp. NKUCC04_CG]